jgi:hypothetical protein
MEKSSVSKYQLTSANDCQIISMGGPYIGDVMFEGKVISEGGISDNYVYKEDSGLLFFVKYHRISKWQKNNYFTINFYNINNNKVYEFDRKFDMVHIKQFISSSELEIFRAFHDQYLSKREIFNLDDEELTEV